MNIASEFVCGFKFVPLSLKDVSVITGLLSRFGFKNAWWHNDLLNNVMFVGVEFAEMQEDETLGQFKSRVRNAIELIFKEVPVKQCMFHYGIVSYME